MNVARSFDSLLYNERLVLIPMSIQLKAVAFWDISLMTYDSSGLPGNHNDPLYSWCNCTRSGGTSRYYLFQVGTSVSLILRTFLALPNCFFAVGIVSLDSSLTFFIRSDYWFSVRKKLFGLGTFLVDIHSVPRSSRTRFDTTFMDPFCRSLTCSSEPSASQESRFLSLIPYYILFCHSRQLFLSILSVRLLYEPRILRVWGLAPHFLHCLSGIFM